VQGKFRCNRLRRAHRLTRRGTLFARGQGWTMWLLSPVR